MVQRLAMQECQGGSLKVAGMATYFVHCHWEVEQQFATLFLLEVPPSVAAVEVLLLRFEEVVEQRHMSLHEEERIAQLQALVVLLELVVQ